MADKSFAFPMGKNIVAEKVETGDLAIGIDIVET
jgi:hypothetical protein